MTDTAKSADEPLLNTTTAQSHNSMAQVSTEHEPKHDTADAVVDQEAGEKPDGEKQKEGSIRDFIVGNTSPSTNLLTHAVPADISLRRPPRLYFVRHLSHRCHRGRRCPSIDDISLRPIDRLVQRVRRWPNRRTPIRPQGQSPCSILCVSFRCPLRHWVRLDTMHLYRRCKNHAVSKEGLPGESAEAGSVFL